MNASNGLKIRPMTTAEQMAIDMHDAGRDIVDICKETGLTRPQVAAAIELREEFGKILEPQPQDKPVMVDRPSKAPSAPKAASVTQARPKPKTPARSETDGDIWALLDAADASPQLRARQLAKDIRDGIPALRKLLRNDEKVRTLTISARMLREQLAKAERELAELVGEGGIEVDGEGERASASVGGEPVEGEPTEDAAPTPEPEPPADTAGTQSPSDLVEVAAAAHKRDALAYSETVRSWARSNGYDVGPSGRMSGGVVIAYRNAHPEEGE